MSTKHNYREMKDHDILLIIAEKVDDLPERVQSLEKKWAWLSGIGSAVSTFLAYLEIKRHP